MVRRDADERYGWDGRGRTRSRADGGRTVQVLFAGPAVRRLAQGTSASLARRGALAAIVAGLMAVAGGALAAQTGTAHLHVYGPGGPLEPMKACSAQFTQKTGIAVTVVGGPESEWIAKAREDADLIFGGAEYMLTDFDLRQPGFIDPATRVTLYDRAAGILVRKGNPKKIRSLDDLARPGVRLVDVNGAGQLGLWEDLAGRRGLIHGIRQNIAVSVRTSAEAIALWKSQPDLDAWISYESWHYRLMDATQLVRLPVSDRLYRGTPVAIAARSLQADSARALISHLRSAACHDVFRRWGWR